MLTYKAMYKFLETGVHGEVLDFPGVITCGKDLEDTRRLLSSALVDMAETNLNLGESLPVPNPSLHDTEADLEEPIHLVLTATTRVKILPETVYEAA
jgi:predicted RNase H-like HicB family nuclease